jgi:hypothetical protein
MCKQAHWQQIHIDICYMLIQSSTQRRAAQHTTRANAAREEEPQVTLRNTPQNFLPPKIQGRGPTHAKQMPNTIARSYDYNVALLKERRVLKKGKAHRRRPS